MKKTLCILLLCIVSMSLSGCAAEKPSPLVNLDEYVFEQSLESCRAKAIDFGRYSTSRRSYFELCMHENGYEPSTYKHLWINL